jgi:hypothetical protein
LAPRLIYDALWEGLCAFPSIWDRILEFTSVEDIEQVASDDDDSGLSMQAALRSYLRCAGEIDIA